MATSLFPGEADVPDDYTQPTSRHEQLEASPPHLFQFVLKRLIALEMPQLALARLPIVLFKRPVGRRSNDEVKGLGIRGLSHVSGIAKKHPVFGGKGIEPSLRGGLELRGDGRLSTALTGCSHAEQYR